MKIKNIIYIFALIFVQCILTPLAQAQVSTATPLTLDTLPGTGNSTSTSGSVLGLQAPPVPSLITAIKQAKQQLATVKLNHVLSPVYKTVTMGKTKNKKAKQVVSGYSLENKGIALAVLDPSTNNVAITIGRQNGKSMVFPDESVSLIKFNGVNSRFSVSKPEGGIIVAEKYLISSIESGNKAEIENSLSEAIYVPYSPGLGSPEVTKYGEDYLNGVIKKVAADLQNFPSSAISGKTITQAIPPALIKALVYAEHTDTTQVLTGNVQETINQLNILFAANEGDAYKYSVSTASARGIAQFIPSTYQSLVQRHPEANLINSFAAGMSNHENSIKAMYLLLDDYAGAVRVKGSLGFTEGQVFDYGAAAYNGGTARVAKAVNTYGSNWNQDHSGEINTLITQVGSLKSQVNSVKSKINKTKDKKTKSDFQSQLSSASAQLASANSSLDALQSATLRNETVNYLNKIYKVIHVFNGQEI